LVLDMLQVSLDEAMTGPAYRSYFPYYEKDKSPVKIFVFDPTVITQGSYEIKFDGVANTSGWVLTNTDNGSIIPSEHPIGTVSEQVLGDSVANQFHSYGLAADIASQIEAGNVGADNNGFLEATINYSDPSR